MAIPIGTTSRQLGALVRWMYLAMVLAGVLAWWWPDYGRWGALACGLMAVLLLWLCWRTVSLDRTVPGHPIYLVLLVPAAILTYHLSRTGLGRQADARGLVSGALNASLLFHLAMLSLGVMLSQSLLPKAITRDAVAHVCGAAMIAGGVLAGLRDDAEPVRVAISLVGFGGVAVWLAPIWRPSISVAHQGFNPSPHHRMWRICSLAIAVLSCGVLAWICPGAAILASGGAGATLVTAAVIFARRSRQLLVFGAILAVAGGLAGAIHGDVLPGSLSLGAPWLGAGEQAFGWTVTPDGQVAPAVTARDSGIQILCRTIGPPGAIATVAGLAACLVMFLVRARRDHAGDKAQCVAWTVAALLCTGALLSAGGLFIPSIVLAVGLTWGLAAEAAGRSARPRPGIVILVILAGTMVLLGVARTNGLLVWAVEALRPGHEGDKLLHAIFGLMLAMTMAWLMGSRKVKWGLAAIAVAALAGGAGEIVQHLTSTGRTVEWTDWGAHIAGCLAAAAPYLLCVGARQCESTDATGQDHRAIDPYIG